ncbi:hypothetical protein ACFFHM_14625 [Halalkalibacter kiskunsagensis]|uniref:Sporulation protein n=1 Tax=Halalkalibacter kiskunsagensis TaxID=1548599 RepID=A0ABV6KEF7_9BACI
MNKKWLSCVAVGLFLVAGCSDPEPPKAQGKTVQSHEKGSVAYGLLGPGPINYGSLYRQKPTFDHMGEINTGTSFKTLNRERRHLGNDQELIRHIIEDEYGMNAGVVVIAGSHAFVNVTPPAGMDEENKKETMEKLKRALLLEVPSYQLHVSEKNA